MAYRNKTYVAFDGDRDSRYYYLMKAWHDNDNSSFIFYDAHDLSSSRDSSLEELIKASLRIRMANAKVFALLVGESSQIARKASLLDFRGKAHGLWLPDIRSRLAICV